jgi:hypothetical protein
LAKAAKNACKTAKTGKMLSCELDITPTFQEALNAKHWQKTRD